MLRQIKANNTTPPLTPTFHTQLNFLKFVLQLSV